MWSGRSWESWWGWRSSPRRWLDDDWTGAEADANPSARRTGAGRAITIDEEEQRRPPNRVAVAVSRLVMRSGRYGQLPLEHSVRQPVWQSAEKLKLNVVWLS